METSLAITAQERPQRAVARREAADPLAAILAGQLSEHTRRAYRHDLGHLLAFLDEGPDLAWGGRTLAEKHGLIEQACADPEAVSRLLTLTRAELITFRTHLKAVGLSTLAVNRRLAGVGTILRELQLQGHRSDNPAERLRTLRTNGDYSPTIGLSAEQAKALLAAPVGDELPALRDRALLALMLRNGLRAAEAVGLCVGDLGEDQGFRVATVHGEGGKLRKTKLAGAIWETLQAWCRVADRWSGGPDAPAFVPVRRAGCGGEAVWMTAERRLTTRGLARIVRERAAEALPAEVAAQVHPHALRHLGARSRCLPAPHPVCPGPFRPAHHRALRPGAGEPGGQCRRLRGAGAGRGWQTTVLNPAIRAAPRTATSLPSATLKPT